MFALLIATSTGYIAALYVHRGHVVIFLYQAGAALAVVASVAGFGGGVFGDESAPNDAGPSRFEVEEALDRTHADPSRIFSDLPLQYLTNQRRKVA